ncbi:MAG: YcaO-like family protein [Calditrichia bacterium]
MNELKRFQLGTHRVASPDKTLERVRPYLKAMGITRVANVTGLDTIGIPVVTVMRPNSRSLSVAQGKGVTLESAKASGIMESIEAYHAETISHELRYCHLEQILAEGQQAVSEGLPLTGLIPFMSSRKILWIQGRSLFTRQPTWVPYEAVHLDFTKPLPTGSGVFVQSSNGLASGNSKNEAIGHALCELIERDAAARWHRGSDHRYQLDRVDLSNGLDDVNRELLKKCAAADVEVASWNLTTKIGIPVFYTLLFPSKDSTLMNRGAIGGYGCHPNTAIALGRSITEAAQARLTLISGSRDDLLPERYNELLDYENTHDLVNKLGVQERKISLSQTRSFSASTFAEDIKYLLKSLQANAYDEAVVVDLSQERFNIPVVRVLVPGLKLAQRKH